MDGECSITKAGTKRIYTYGSTTANHTVDALAVIVYVDQYNEKDGKWHQIDAFSKKVENDYYSAISKSIQVDGDITTECMQITCKNGGRSCRRNLFCTDGILVP